MSGDSESALGQTLALHEQIVESFERFYGECSCGWTGQERATHEDAVEDAKRHAKKGVHGV